MVRRTIDARGKACPQPVLDARQVLEDPAVTEAEVLVDNQAAAENVARMARSQGCEVRLEDSGAGELRVLLTRRVASAPVGSAAEASHGPGCGAPTEVAVFVASDGIGRGDEELGRALMLAFLGVLKELVPRPTSLLLMNAGVRLATEGSRALPAIAELEGMGVEVLACGTCLDFFGLDDKLAAGRVSNMLEIASRLISSDRVVRP